MASAERLEAPQLQALFDILTHNTVYAEIQDFRKPQILESYGPPFRSPAHKPSNTPCLQSLVSKFIVPLPGLKNVSSEFWTGQIGSLIEGLEEAELSESYDKGTLGIRKTLATAISALIEYPVRGVYGGFETPKASTKEQQYNTSKSTDLERAFRDIMIQAVYGSAIDDIFKKTAETDKLADHTPLVRAAHEFGLVNLASFMHFTLIKSPKGQQLLTLIDHANKLIPYTVIRQTLKIGNVASMISAMVRVVLAKMSVASVTNWIGWTKDSDEGMNLLQSIISTVLNWDIRDLKSRATKIEKSKEAPSKEQLATIEAYLDKSREEHEALRERSVKTAESIVHVILKNNNTSTSLTATKHTLLLEYLSLHLAIRDRNEIIRNLCHSQPDHLTTSVRDLVSAYEPIIRNVHNAVDLSESLYDFEIFLRDMIKLAKLPNDFGKRRATPTPTVGDFVQLLKKHQKSSHKFLHQVAKNGPEVTQWFHEYAIHSASQFKRQEQTDASDGAGDLSSSLQDLWAKLDANKRQELLHILDAHASYLSKLHAASSARLRSVVSSPSTGHPALKSPGSAPGSRSSSPAPFGNLKEKKSEPKIRGGGKQGQDGEGDNVVAGPGAYLARWQHLLDATLITPAENTGGKVRGGGFKSVIRASERTVGSKEEQAELADEGKHDEEDLLDKDPADQIKGGQEEDSDDEDIFEDAKERLDALGLSSGEKKEQEDLRVDTAPVIEALGKQFRELLAQRSCYW